MRSLKAPEPYAELFRTFVRADIDLLARENAEGRSRELFAAATRAARDHYRILGEHSYTDVEDLQLELWIVPGSTKTKFIAMAKKIVLVAAAGFASYGNIRSGVIAVAHDTMAAAKVVRNAIDNQFPPSSIISHSRRPGLPGKLEALFEKVESGNLSAREASIKADRLLMTSAIDPDVRRQLKEAIFETEVHPDQDDPQQRLGLEIQRYPWRSMPLPNSMPPTLPPALPAPKRPEDRGLLLWQGPGNEAGVTYLE